MADEVFVVVFAECGFQNPVAAVLDTPMLTNLALERGGRFVEGADVVAGFTADFIAVELGGLGFDVNQAEEIAPFSSDLGVHPVDGVVDRDASRDGAAVGFIDPLFVTPALAVREIEITNGEVELILCFLVKVPLVVFEDTMYSAFFWIMASRGDDLAGKGMHLDEAGNGGDFVAFNHNIILSKTESAFRCPSAQDVAGFGIDIVAAAQPLAIDGA